DHSQSAIDIYADSKITGESLVRASSLNTVILRIAPIAVPAFLEPPDPWPFMEDQRVEMVHRDDVVDALFASVSEPDAYNKIFNIAGGPTWQLRGKNYANDFYEFMGAPADEAVYRDAPGWVDWYDSEESQAILKYQSRSYEHYAHQMREIVEALMAE
ncbi:MAG: NAD(P)-dependent oxidoreductase, partial [Chloroflexi bacterium]|nr:NAD(P)-dependent oxidoreductase [Chloroflexota bacterium]